MYQHRSAGGLADLLVLSASHPHITTLLYLFDVLRPGALLSSCCAGLGKVFLDYTAAIYHS